MESLARSRDDERQTQDRQEQRLVGATEEEAAHPGVEPHAGEQGQTHGGQGSDPREDGCED